VKTAPLSLVVGFLVNSGRRFLSLLSFSLFLASLATTIYFPISYDCLMSLFLAVGFSLFYCVLAFLCFFPLVSCRSLSGTKLCRVQSRLAHVPSQVSPAGGRISRDKAQRPSPPFNLSAVDIGRCSVCATFWTWRPSCLAMQVHRGRPQWLPPPLRLLRRRPPRR